MLSRSLAVITFLSLGISGSAQAWGGTFAIRGVFDGQFPWVESVGSPLNVGINYISKPTSDTTFFKWFIQSAQNSTTDPSIFVTIFNSFGGFASPFGGEPRVCGGEGMLLRTTFTAFPTVWKLTLLGGDQYKISTNVTSPNLGGVSTEVFWSMHSSTGLLPLDPANRTDCTDAGGISQVFQILPPSVFN